MILYTMSMRKVVSVLNFSNFSIGVPSTVLRYWSTVFWANSWRIISRSIKNTPQECLNYSGVTHASPLA